MPKSSGRWNNRPNRVYHAHRCYTSRYLQEDFISR